MSDGKKLARSPHFKCECGHPAHFHGTGACGGYALSEKFMTQDTFLSDGRRYLGFCSCQKNHWEVVDDFIENVIDECTAKQM